MKPEPLVLALLLACFEGLGLALRLRRLFLPEPIEGVESGFTRASPAVAANAAVEAAATALASAAAAARACGEGLDGTGEEAGSPETAAKLSMLLLLLLLLLLPALLSPLLLLIIALLLPLLVLLLLLSRFAWLKVPLQRTLLLLLLVLPILALLSRAGRFVAGASVAGGEDKTRLRAWSRKKVTAARTLQSGRKSEGDAGSRVTGSRGLVASQAAMARRSKQWPLTTAGSSMSSWVMLHRSV